MPDPSVRTLSAKELADALGVPVGRIRHLVSAGMPRVGRGSYDLVACARWYAASLVPAAGDGDAPTLDEARYQKLLAETIRAERQLHTLERQALPAEFVDGEIVRVLEHVSRVVTSAAPIWVQRLTGCESHKDAVLRLDELVEELMDRLRRVMEGAAAAPAGGEAA